MAGLYDRLVLPRLIEWACSHDSIGEQRQIVVPKAEGTVLEVGIGSGLNLPFYDRSKVKNIIGVDPGEGILKLGEEKFANSDIPVEILTESAESIPIEDASIDTVLLTWAGCSIPDIRTALTEMRRVLRPDGKLVFVEHGRSNEPHIARRQDWLNKIWPIFAGGCNVNRDIAALLTETGFNIPELDMFYTMKSPKTVSFHYRGTATKA
ncbi:MAG TPA: class I SAM-dependent methyltransferase [Rhizobiales bacterium]|nr:class I SAM-dependent methyltransferase [Hyphomicrobiales bacterium]